MASVNGKTEAALQDGDRSCPFVPDALPQKATTMSRVYLAVVEDDPTFAYGGKNFKCRINAIAHPNHVGAQAYAESIAGSTQKPGLLDAAWALDPTRPAN